MATKILVIDDSEVALQVIKDDLEGGGFNVLLARSSEEAEGIIQSDMPDVILVDVMMPGMDGGAYCKLVKSRPETKDIPVILVSMKEEDEIKVIIDHAGADGYLWKANVSAISLAKIIEKFE